MPGRISCVVVKDGDWPEHCAAIKRTLANFASLLREEREKGMDIAVDVAIEPEDYQNRVLHEFVLDAEFLRIIADAGISVVFSIYGTLV